MTETLKLDEERAKFEQHFEHAGALPWGYLAKQRTGNGYSIQIYSYMWNAWLARAQLEESCPTTRS
jgi:hypothetical protein